MHLHCGEWTTDKGPRDVLLCSRYAYALHIQYAVCCVMHCITQTRSTVQIEIFKYQPENGFSKPWTKHVSFTTRNARTLSVSVFVRFICIVRCFMLFCTVCFSFIPRVCASCMHAYCIVLFATAHRSIPKLICHLRALHFMYVFHIICNIISPIHWMRCEVITVVIVHKFETRRQYSVLLLTNDSFKYDFNFDFYSLIWRPHLFIHHMFFVHAPVPMQFTLNVDIKFFSSSISIDKSLCALCIHLF